MMYQSDNCVDPATRLMELVESPMLSAVMVNQTSKETTVSKPPCLHGCEVAVVGPTLTVANHA